ncbi:unnamed protein product [Caenorhabditis brenneri]
MLKGHASTRMGLATIGTTASSNNNGLSKINECIIDFSLFCCFVVSERCFVRVQLNWPVNNTYNWQRLGFFVEEFKEFEDFSLKSSIDWRIGRNRDNSCAQNLETSRRSRQQQKKCRRAIGRCSHSPRIRSRFHHVTLVIQSSLEVVVQTATLYLTQKMNQNRKFIVTWIEDC